MNRIIAVVLMGVMMAGSVLAAGPEGVDIIEALDALGCALGEEDAELLEELARSFVGVPISGLPEEERTWIVETLGHLPGILELVTGLRLAVAIDADARLLPDGSFAVRYECVLDSWSLEAVQDPEGDWTATLDTPAGGVEAKLFLDGEGNMRFACRLTPPARKTPIPPFEAVV